MTATSETPQAAPSLQSGRPREYGVSVLLTACARMTRGVIPGTLAVVVNALIQAALTHLDAPVGMNPAFIIATLVSIASIITGAAIITATALESVSGSARLPAVLARVGANFGRYLLWALVVWVVMIAAGMLQPGLATIVALVGAMIPIAAMDGHSNALGTAMIALRERFGRWLATSFIVSLGALVLWLLAAVNVFFVTGMLASLIFWLVAGTLLWWLAVAWACMYRSTFVGAGA